MVAPLFGAIGGALPSIASIESLSNAVNEIGEAYEKAAAQAQKFYGLTISSNIELQQQIRQSTLLIAAQTQAFDSLGNEITDFSDRFATIEPQIKQIQKEIEIATRDIVGATDAITNAVLNQTINQFSQLTGQTKEFATELEAIPTLVTGLTSALTAFQIPEFQIPQEIRALLQGDLNNPDAQLARQLQSVGLTKELLEQARASGTAIDLLNEKLSSFIQANASGADTIENSFSVIQSVIDQAFRSLGEDPTEGLQRGLASIKDVISTPEFEQGIKDSFGALGGPIGEAVEKTLESFAKTLEDIFKSFQENREEFLTLASTVGNTIGDLITIVGGLVNGVVRVITFLAEKVGGLIMLLEKATDAVSNLFNAFDRLGSLDLEVKVDGEESLTDFQKDLEARGAAGTIWNVVLQIGSSARDVNQASVDAIKNTRELIEQEVARNETFVLEPALEFAPRVAAVDTSSIEQFTFDLKSSVEENIENFKEEVDLSGLSAATVAEIESLLETVTNTADFTSAQESIRQLVLEAQLGGEEAVDQFRNQLTVLDNAIEATRTARDEFEKQAQLGGLVQAEIDELKELDNLLERQIEKRNKISEALDPTIARQREIIANLEAEGKDTTEAIKVLDELIERRKTLGDPTTLNFRESVELGTTLVKTFNDLNDALGAYLERAGKDPTQVADAFEQLSGKLQDALQTGAVSVEAAANILTNAVQDTQLPIEQRFEAEQQLVKLLNEESQLTSKLVDLDNLRLDLANARGDINNDELEVLRAENDLKKNAIDLQRIENEIAINKLAVETGVSKAIENRIEARNKEIAKASDEQKIALLRANTEDEALLTQAGIGTQKLRGLESDRKEIELNGEILKQRVSQLELLKSLNEEREKATNRETDLSFVTAERNKQLEELRTNLPEGTLQIDIDFQAREGELEDVQQQIKNAQQEIADLDTARSNEIQRQIDLNGEFVESQEELQVFIKEREGLQLQVLGLQAEEVKLSRELGEDVLAREIEARREVQDLQTQAIEDADTLLQAEFRLEQSILDSATALEQVDQIAADLQDSFDNLALVDIKLELQGIERIDTLKKKLANATDPAQADALKKAIAETAKLTGADDTSLQARLNAIDKIAKAETEAVRNQQKLQDAAITAKIQQQRLSLQVVDAEISKEQALLRIKEAQLQIRRDELKAQLAQGKISQKTFDTINKGLDNQQKAYKNVESSLKNQRKSNKAIEDSLDDQESSQKTINKNTADIKANAIATDAAFKKQDATLDGIVSDTNKIANNTSKFEGGGGSQEGGSIQVTGIANDKIRQDFEEAKGILTEAEFQRAFTIEDPELIPGVKKVRRTGRFGSIDLETVVENQRILAEAAVGSVIDAAIRKARNEAEGKGRVSLADRGKPNTVGAISSGSESRPKPELVLSREEEILQQLLELSSGPLTANDINRIGELNQQLEALLTAEENPLLEGLTQELQGLLAINAGLRTEEQNERIIELLASIDELTAEANQEQITPTTLLEALNSGAFQAGSFTPNTDATLFVDPNTNQIVVGGSVFDEEVFQRLINTEIGSLNPSLGDITVPTPVVITDPVGDPVVRGGGGSSSSSSTGSGGGTISSSNTSSSTTTTDTTIVNNYYPDNAGYSSRLITTTGISGSGR